MRRARSSKFRAQLVAYKFARRSVREVNVGGVGNPPLDRPEGSKALWRGQSVLQGLHLGRRQGFALASGNVDCEQGKQAAIAVGGEPAPHGIVIDT